MICKLVNLSIKKPILLMLVFICASGNYAQAEVKLTEEWKELSNGLWSFFITPRGTLEPRYYNNPKCYVPTSNGYCNATWRLVITNGVANYSAICRPMVRIPRGTSYKASMNLINAQTMGERCGIGNFEVNGNEKICFYNTTDGTWKDDQQSIYNGINFYGNEYCYGNGEGAVKPPIEPVNCNIGDITINHNQVPANEINNSLASALSKITCNRKANIKLSIKNSGKVTLNKDGTLYSTISINGTAGGGQITVEKEVSIDVTSKLSYIGKDHLNGDFNNTAVLTYTFQ
ncbi:hypothetical protein ID864_18545 [Erwinia aphidicola]|jgi:hypothetical protein|uniref:Fimbrial adhesin MrpH C-terminal domain-containing protein n=1 Tax=Erwinia aphidicola TaxID=68334 RepID=A0ABU8DIH3_ERWAP|nr:hypothetical protein [Erwinia aphidicola]MBD1377612.1 hypothetical protein [Erwinia aphidicola]